MRPIISIVIPCFNHGAFLEETLESISRSTDAYLPEIIIVNDGSTDTFTLQVFQRIEEKGYFVLHQENQGLAKARNNGIRLAKGKYILPLDSDNNVCKPYLNKAIDLLEHSEQTAVVYGDAFYIGEKTGLWKNDVLNISKMLFSNQVDACALFRKTTWETVGGYSEDMPYMGCEDWNFWLKCLDKKQGFHYLNEVCFEYRVLSNSMIRTVPEDFDRKIKVYNYNQLLSFFTREIKEEQEVMHNVFHGSLLKKCTKIVLNHFGLYDYKKRARKED